MGKSTSGTQNQVNRWTHDDTIYDSTEGDVSQTDVVVEEDEFVLTTDEVMEDVGTIDSDDDFDLHGS